MGRLDGREKEREGAGARGRLDYSARNVAITNNINSRPGNANRAASNWAGSKKETGTTTTATIATRTAAIAT